MGPEQISRAADHMVELLEIRTAERSGFQMPYAGNVRDTLRFANTGPDQVPGLIVMHLGVEGAERVVVVFNATREAQQVAFAKAGGFTLHPVQQLSSDPILRSASASADGFDVPALTTAVFVRTCQAEGSCL